MLVIHCRAMLPDEVLMQADFEWPEVLYHYTSMDTLLKIVQHHELWATSFAYLNDITEMEHLVRLVRARLPSLLIDDPELDPHLFSLLVAGPSTKIPAYYTTYITSFSEARDSLTQWRSYCPNRNGVCIGFRTTSLLKATLAQNGPDAPNGAEASTKLLPVQYVDDAETPTIDRFIYKAVEITKREMMKLAKWNFPKAIAEETPMMFRGTLIESAAQVKDGSFRSESEYRLIASNLSQPRDFVRYRASKSTLVPYCVFSIPDPEESSIDDGQGQSRSTFIRDVIVGPTPHPDLSMDSLKGLFTGFGASVTVTASKVPYRDW
jgi:hypothetical protein